MDLVLAYRACRLRKPGNSSQSKFERYLGKSLLDLQQEIREQRYRPSPMKCFVVSEPKAREIFAAEFRDRVVHHLIVTVMEPIWERKFVHASFACRKGKGVHAALSHFQNEVRRISRGGRSPVWALKLDLARFFVTIHRPTLCQLMERHAPFSEVKRLVRTTYLHDGRLGARILNEDDHRRTIDKSKSWFGQESDRGLPIGNLTSQFGANVYLNALDHFILRSLKPLGYLRYMDDLLLLDWDVARLSQWTAPIDEWLQQNRLQNLNPAKTKLVRLDEGLTYLGCEAAQVGPVTQPLLFFPTGKKKWKFIRGLRRIERLNEDVFFEKPHPLASWSADPRVQRELASTNSHFGNLIHSESYKFRKIALEKLEKNQASNQPPHVFADPWRPFKIKKGYRSLRLR